MLGDEDGHANGNGISSVVDNDFKNIQIEYVNMDDNVLAPGRVSNLLFYKINSYQSSCSM
jgi:hypothetical protein